MGIVETPLLGSMATWAGGYSSNTFHLLQPPGNIFPVMDSLKKDKNTKGNKNTTPSFQHVDR